MADNAALIAEARRYPHPDGALPAAPPADLIARLADALEGAAAEPELPTQHRAERGTMFACSWGYDQTNVDYYVVLSRTAKMAYIARIKQGDLLEIGRRVKAGDAHKLENGTLEKLGRFKIHDAAMGGRDGLRDIDSKYALWFAPHEFANAYWWRGEEMYETPFGLGH